MNAPATYTVTSVATRSSMRIRPLASTSDPLAAIPEGERWIWANSEAMQSFVRGKEDVRHDRIFDLGSFAQYVDIDVDD